MPAAAVVGIGLLVGGTAYSIQQQRQAAKAQRRAQQMEQRKQELQQVRERRNQVRQARIAAARLTQGGINAGTGQDSSVASGVTSVQSQLSSNLAFLDNSAELTRAQSMYLQKAGTAQSNANIGASVASLGGTIFSMGSGGGGKTTTTKASS